MYQDTRTLREIEDQLYIIITRYLEDALVRGDFLETILGVYQGLTGAFEIALKNKGILLEKTPPDSKSEFSCRAKAAIPEIWEKYQDKELDYHYNICVHPGADYIYNLSSEDIKNMARTFVELAIDSWPVLFPNSPPKVENHPIVYARNDIVDPAEVTRLQGHLTDAVYKIDMLNRDIKRKEEQKNQVEAERDDLQAEIDSRLAWNELPWNNFFIGLAFLTPTPLFAGFGAWLWQERPEIKYWSLIPATAVFVLLIFSIRYFWNFFQTTRPIPVLSFICILVVTLILIITPFTKHELAWYERPGSALSLVLEKVGGGLGGYVNTSMDLGGLVSKRLFSGSGPNEQASFETSPTATLPPPSSTPTSTAWPTPTPSSTATGTATATPTPSVTPTSTRLPNRDIQVGYYVLVNTDGSQLLARTEPRSGATAKTNFANGTLLLVIGGPESSDEFIWWKVQGENGEGWCVGAFLKPEDQ